MMADGNEEQGNLLPSHKESTIVENADRAELDAFVAYLQERYQRKEQERQQNISPNRPAGVNFLLYDSSFKKNTVFVKRLKQFTAQQLPSLMQHVSRFNLTSYISGVCEALVGAKLKMSDIDAALTLCTHLHRKYANFAPTMFESWQKLLSIKPCAPVTNPSKMRVDLRFFAELISVGIFSCAVGMSLLHDCLFGFIAGDEKKHLNLSIVLSFCKHCGNEFTGLVPTRMNELAKKYDVTIPMSQLVPPTVQSDLRNLLQDYYESLVKHLQSEHMNLHLMEKPLNETAKVERTTKKHEYEMLYASTSSLADLLGEGLPLLEELQEPDAAEEETGEMLRNEILDPWRNSETKSFYVDLPDLGNFLANYDKGKEDDDENHKQATVQEQTTITDTIISKQLLDMELFDLDEHRDDLLSASSCPEDEEDMELVVWNQGDNEIFKQATHKRILTADDENSTRPDPNSKHYFVQFAKNLQCCINREMIDKAAIEFLQHLNVKGNRKRLVTVLFTVQRTRLDRLPMYARFVAIINLISSDVARELCHKLKVEFFYHLKKDQLQIEPKIKLIRYIGELVKFGLYEKEEALYCLRCLLQSFQHHNVEMACALLEVCGVYLFNCTESRVQVNAFLEQMMGLKMNTLMQDRHEQQVESVYYLLKRPVSLKDVQKKLPIMHAYIRWLIFQELGKSNVDKIILQFRRLNWYDMETSNYAIQCLSQAYNIRYQLITYLADMLQGLSTYQRKVVVRVIDTVLEDIRVGMAIHDPALAGRQIAMIKYLGELYNYQLVESDTIFTTLYSIISFGVNLSHDEPSAIDPPESLFRLKLACKLLNTCGQFLNIGDERHSFDHFIVFFQRYYWHKKSHPIFVDQRCVGMDEQLNMYPVLMDHMYHECLKRLRPNLKVYSSLEEANNAVEDLRQKFFNGKSVQQVDHVDSILLHDCFSDDEKKDVLPSSSAISNLKP
ncbi:regulator of nonsense transcripts 2-like [Anopheles funestus]|uniref:regulator of nonsense transcripts 2-like n=1 Tax=Anopheles funestus TaxID=62324 RepID=UPI0020C62B2E|nr:regulator of nonsense transcripts 2-like [Anopheles funestus]XP_049298948.1 regulator of nonsense transcripts 2-like [Anopheles funestus]XP_049298949.1 regulator of nonsense transcripts 2-like [Anopheles funestus]